MRKKSTLGESSLSPLQASPWSLHLQTLAESYQDVTVCFPVLLLAQCTSNPSLTQSCKHLEQQKAIKYDEKQSGSVLMMYLALTHIVTLQARPCQFPICFKAQVLSIQSEILGLVSKSHFQRETKCWYITVRLNIPWIKQPGSVQQPERQSNLRSTDYINNLALPQEAKMGLHPFGDKLRGQVFLLWRYTG